MSTLLIVSRRGSPEFEAAVNLGADVGGAACSGGCCGLEA